MSWGRREPGHQQPWYFPGKVRFQHNKVEDLPTTLNVFWRHSTGVGELLGKLIHFWDLRIFFIHICETFHSNRLSFVLCLLSTSSSLRAKTINSARVLWKIDTFLRLTHTFLYKYATLFTQINCRLYYRYYPLYQVRVLRHSIISARVLGKMKTYIFIYIHMRHFS